MTTDVESIVGPYPNTAEVLAQAFDTKPWWWTSVIQTTIFDDLPFSSERGAPWKRIGRRDLFAIAANSTASSVDLLIACYAWGMGSSVGNLRRYRRPLRENPTQAISDRLSAARTLQAKLGPEAAYRSLAPSGDNRLVQLGPSFFTKLLYAAGGMASTAKYNALILDRFVAFGLNDLASRGIDTGQRRELSTSGGWSGSVYETWLRFAHTEASRSEASGRVVRADAVELAIFRHGRKIALA